MKPRHLLNLIWLAYFATGLSHTGLGQVTGPQWIVKDRVHLRTTPQQEWAQFPEKFPGRSFQKTFKAEKNNRAHTLLIRQTGVRQLWTVKVNSQSVAKLKRDQNDLMAAFDIPAGFLKTGENTLTISTRDEKTPDDIYVGPIGLVTHSRGDYLNAASLQIEVRDSSGSLTPARITILDDNRTLVPLGIQSNQERAVRNGVVYTLSGRAAVKIPPGKYQVFANRGFEYSQDSSWAEVRSQESKPVKLKIHRVVDTKGWVSCDTHVHTVTHSGHGDCTIEERMITLAGENIELPVATDHNKQIDYRPIARRLKTDRYFTPLIGNEVTTDFGHFNAFPFSPQAAIPNFREANWNVLLKDIFSKPDVQIAILNHARDVHRGYRPFAPENFNRVTGESLNGRPFLFNAMEVINSAAQQTDPFELFRDWMATVNRGHRLLPIGSSDSHDVNAFIVGQGRTYIRCPDQIPGQIDVKTALSNLKSGQLLVSCGLLATINVNQKFGPGDLVDRSKSFTVTCTMTGPHWLPGDTLELYRNGIKVREKTVTPEIEKGKAHRTVVTWNLPAREFDSFLTLLVSGPGFRHPSWSLAPPYQPTSPIWKPRVFGLTGAVYLDENGDGKFNSAFEIAKQCFDESKGNLKQLSDALSEYDAAVCAQAASLYQEEYASLLSKSDSLIWRQASPSVRTGFRDYLTAWRQSQSAQIKQKFP